MSESAVVAFVIAFVVAFVVSLAAVVVVVVVTAVVVAAVAVYVRMSDGMPICGRKRTPYLVASMLIIAGPRPPRTKDILFCLS